MVFRINTDGSGYSAVKVLGGTAGRWPRGKLELSGTTLYGAAYAGGSGCGTVFKANTDGSGFSVLKQFTGGLDGGYPCTGVALWGTTLYGTAARGGSSNKGTFFQLNTDGSNFTVLKSFTGNDGDYPFGNLLLSGATFYGTTVYGGTSNCGVVFACSLADPPVVRWLSPSRTAELGSTVRFAVRAEGSNPRMCQWFFNGTNALTGSTTDFSLTLTNLQAVQAGAYTVIVTNVAGAVTSSPALLSVIPPVQRAMVPGIHVTGDAGSSIQLDCSGSQTPPCYWWPLDSVDLSGASAYYFDLSTPLPAQRFYRTRQVGVPGVAPALGISLVPAVTLTGGVGSRVRLDGINAVGPTDAWFTVATVALTNTSQLYFDVSAASQPNRCYRVVPVP
jgi:uncharacterized repeat protein (TIGR03803 family)